jgi:hypothetical protein
MATVADLDARLETLRAARAAGVLMVRTADGRTVTYKSDGELAAAIADVEHQRAGAINLRINTILVGSSKGLDTP